MNPTSKATPRFQFSIATAFCVVTTIAILCLLAVWTGIFPYWTILPGLFFGAACFVARSRISPDLAWGLLGIAWFTALLYTASGLEQCFNCISGKPRAFDLQYGFFLAYGPVLALPFFVSLPAIYLSMKASKGTRSHARKWLISCWIVGLVDVTVLTVLLILFAEPFCSLLTGLLHSFMSIPIEPSHDPCFANFW